MNFVKTSHNVSIAVLLSCLYRLQMVLLDQSFFLFEDIRRTVEEVVHSQYVATIETRTSKKAVVRAEETEVKSEDLNTFEYDKRDEGRNGDIEGEGVWSDDVSCKGEGEGEEEMKVMEVMVVFYTGLVYELCVTPRMSMEGPRLGMLPPFDEAAVSEERLVQWLLQRLVERNEKEEGRYELLMDGMRLEAKKYEVSEVVDTGEQRETYDYHYPYEDAFQSKPNAYPIDTSPDHHVWSTSITVADSNDNLAPSSALASTTAIERHDAVVRLLAHIRKSGMDIVFPQDLHDRMLLIFYMSAKCAAPLAHRELMDMILAVQRTRILGEELEMVSKTKVRGILALLKNAHALLATAGQGDSVRLYLGKAVTTFRMFREKHDAFINRCILQQHMFLPLTVKVEVLWQGSDEQSIMDRCEALREFESLIEDFIMKSQSQSQSRYQGLSGTPGPPGHPSLMNIAPSVSAIHPSQRSGPSSYSRHSASLQPQPSTVPNLLDTKTSYASIRYDEGVLPYARSSPPLTSSYFFSSPSPFTSSMDRNSYQRLQTSPELRGMHDHMHSQYRQTMMHFPTEIRRTAPGIGFGSNWTNSSQAPSSNSFPQRPFLDHSPPSLSSSTPSDPTRNHQIPGSSSSSSGNYRNSQGNPTDFPAGWTAFPFPSSASTSSSRASSSMDFQGRLN
eukprot:gene13718-15121_t